jgi:Phosphoesterase family
MPVPADSPIKRVIIIVQENHTTDNYFRGLAPYGAAVATDWPLSPNPPARDQPHDRHAYYDWLTGSITGTHVQFDTANVLPYYLYLAVTGAFLENHCAGFGTNSTPNHLLVLGGQSPTLRNPSRREVPPVWDMPSVPGLAGDNGLSWCVYAAAGQYPAGFYQQLQASPNVVSSSQFIQDAQGGNLPSLVYLYHNSPNDEHPPADVSVGMNTVWQSVDAVVATGGWAETVFMLTWDDWGGFDDHVTTPVVEYTADNVQLAFGPRVPLLMFGGRVKPGIDNRWCGHASIARTAIQLLGLPPLGVPRVDGDLGLADLVDPAMDPSPPPPSFGNAVQIPAPPDPARQPAPPPPPPVAGPAPVGDIVLRDGTTLPPPDDVPLPQQPNPPTNR